jgi:2-methylisocitrate lyase-like PEP mutase family enzyme
MLEHGSTPLLPIEELEAMGFTIAVYPVSGFY